MRIAREIGVPECELCQTQVQSAEDFFNVNCQHCEGINCMWAPGEREYIEGEGWKRDEYGRITPGPKMMRKMRAITYDTEIADPLLKGTFYRLDINGKEEWCARIFNDTIDIIGEEVLLGTKANPDSSIRIVTEVVKVYPSGDEYECICRLGNR